jgi:hypothetical protein
MNCCNQCRTFNRNDFQCGPRVIWDPDEHCCEHFDPLTNADHIRAMSDEELSKFIPDWSYTNACKAGEHYVDCNNECEKCVMDWLKQPYDGGKADGQTD